ncbi:tigger transposable element-derived protein 6-like [Leptopilina heterotoma]|nr:tigger transposable element-derived protein 6-like [Leptopilina heterotoma]
MTGTKKLPLLLIGKSKKPRCFKGVNTLPVEYQSNRKAWMTRQIFTEWLQKVDKKMKNEKTKILLFVDNCTAHTNLPEFNNVKLVLLPANTTSQLQPLDQGIIHAFKRHYRTQVVKHALKCIEENSNQDINVLHAMRFARKAWFAITDVTIKNCFKKAGFWNEEGYGPEESLVETVPSNEEWNTLVADETNVITFEDFVRVDDNMPIAEELTDDDIIANCNNNFDDDDCEEVENSTIAEVSIPKQQEVLSALETIHRFFEFSTNINESVFDKIYELEHHVKNCTTKKQTVITDFFPKA